MKGMQKSIFGKPTFIRETIPLGRKKERRKLVVRRERKKKGRSGKAQCFLLPRKGGALCAKGVRRGFMISKLRGEVESASFLSRTEREKRRSSPRVKKWGETTILFSLMIGGRSDETENSQKRTALPQKKKGLD